MVRRILAFIWVATAICRAAGSVSYTYDSLSRVTSVVYPDGTTVAYTYDAAGNRLSAVISNPSIPSPKISVDKPTLSFTVAAGQISTAQAVAVANTGGGTLQWDAAASSSWLSATPGSGTNAGTVVVTASAAALSAGTYAGAITILAPASNAPLSIPVIFTVTGATGNPTVSSNGIVSAAGSVQGVTRGSVGTIYGTALADAPSSATTVPLPTILRNVQVTVNGINAPLWYVGPGQINFQVPFEAPLQGQASVVVTRAGIASSPSSVALTPYAPSVFMYQRTVGVIDPIIVHASDQSLVTPENPAVPGEYLVVYGTGIGDLTTLPTTGALSPNEPLARANVLPIITVGGVPASVQFAGLTPQAIGLAQFNLQVPEGLPSGPTLPLTINFKGAASRPVQLYVGPVSASQTLTTTTLVSSLSPSILGQSVTLTATVSPAAAPGSVTFYDGTTVLGTSTLAGGQAVLRTTLLPFGTRPLKAYYLGTDGYTPSASPVVAQAIQSLPESGLAAAVNYGAGSQPWSIAVGDFNGDGKQDLAVAFVGSGVDVLPGNGDGTFQASSTYRSGVAPQSVVAGDFNGDGKTDLAVANANCGMGNGTVSVLLGNGDGTFQAAVNYPGTASCLIWLALGDFNRDGRVDVAAVNQTGTLDVFSGNGDGTLQAAVRYNIGTSSNSVAVGDFNLDGLADLAIGTNAGTSILPGNGDGTFNTPVNWGPPANAVSVGDLNGDGKPDLAVTNNNGISILLGNGDGTFQTAVNYLAGVSPQGNVAIGDFNGDGKADLAVASSFVNTAGILLGNGDGTFGPETSYAVGNHPAFIAVGSFSGDGVTDLAVANESNSSLSGGNISVLIGIPAMSNLPKARQ